MFFINKIRHNEKGYTLLELIVVMGIIAGLSTILVGYSRQNSRQLLLASAEAKTLSLISRAKFLSIETFFQDAGGGGGGSTRTCGYGVKVDTPNDEIFIFQDNVPISSSCPGNNVFNPGTDVRLSGDLNEVILDTSVMSLTGGTSLSHVVFIPPDPDIIVNGGSGSATIEIGLNGGGRTFSIDVDSNGQLEVN